MNAPWNTYEFVARLAHLAPGEKLSEAELLGQLAALQWQSIAGMLGRKPSEIVNERGDRLYASAFELELCFAPGRGPEAFGEDARVHVRNRVRPHAKEFVEGLFAIDGREIPDSAVEAVATRDDLCALPCSWAALTAAFVSRRGRNARLEAFEPAGLPECRGEALETTPPGIRLQRQAQASGQVEPLEKAPGIPLVDQLPLERIVYPVVPESDLDVAGRVSLPRYTAVMNFAERRFLCDHLSLPISHDLVACLSTEHRRAFFFSNVGAADRVEAHVAAEVLTPDRFEAPAVGGGYRTPLKMLFRIDLYRVSDYVLVASSLVRKALNVPGIEKSVWLEAGRLLASVRAPGCAD